LNCNKLVIFDLTLNLAFSGKYFSKVSNYDGFVKSPISPPLVGGDKGEGEYL